MSDRVTVGDLYITRDPHGFVIGPRVHSLVDNPVMLITRDDPDYHQWNIWFLLLCELEDGKDAQRARSGT